ncbi:MAG: DNA gyrase subunit A, partial [Clostridia bacterium]|nr:DNA gyrase subunit A [Clostridia bacterium]
QDNSENEEDSYMFMVTKQGTVKRLSLSEIRSFRKSGLRVLSLNDDDQLIAVLPTNGSDEILLGTKLGQAVRFKEEGVRPMGRTAAGVIGIRLDEGDEVIGAAVIDPNGYVLTITASGYGKLTEVEKFPIHNRGGKGVVMHQVTDKTGEVAGLMVCDAEGDIFLVTSEGTMIRTELNSIRICGRSSQGVIVMRTGENEQVIGIAAAPKENDEENEEAESDANEESVENLTESSENSEE